MDSDVDSEDLPWRGCSMNEIYRNLSEWELKHVSPVHPSENHTVLYQWPISNSNEPPKPKKGFSKWDALHVRLPCSPKSQYPVTQNDGTVDIENRWLMIEKALLRPIKNSREFEIAVLSYNSKYKNIWKFRALHKLFEEELDEDEASLFFEDLLPKIIRLALRLPELLPSAIPLLKQGQNRSISMSQQQIACLLANSFLCTFPRRNTTKKKSEYSSFPDINFNRLFQSSGHQVLEKIKCICHYFRRVCNKMPNGVLTFTRRSLTEKELPNWEECNIPLGITPLHITSCGTIEDQGQGLLQVDFANKFLGGGVLGSGCVQEEIRFVICPELIISKLFTEALKPCEALLMIGCEQFSKYSGYASSFTWNGNHDDKTPFDESGRRQCHIVAIDALYFVQSSHQYREELMLRELNKAYVGFNHPLDTPAPGIASGNWGCGAFGGEASLKALIQLMACTITKRPLVYFTFGNRELRDSIHNMHTFFIENNITVKQLWKYLKEFHSRKLSPNDLYSFIIQIYNDYQKPSNKTKPTSPGMNKNITLFSSSKMTSHQETTVRNVNGCNSKCTKVPEILDETELDRIADELSSSSEEIDYFEVIEKQERRKFEEKVSDKLMNKSSATIVSIKKEESSLKDVKLIKQKNSDGNITPVKPEKEKRSRSTPESNTKKESSNMKISERNNVTSKSATTTLKKPSKGFIKNASGDPKQRSLLDMFDTFYTERPAKRHCFSDKEKNNS